MEGYLADVQVVFSEGTGSSRGEQLPWYSACKTLKS